MKTTIINRSLFFLLMLFSSFVQANEEETLLVNRYGHSVVFIPDSLSCFTLFVVQSAEQKNYLIWNVKEQKVSGYYVIERGIDGVNFDFLGLKPGIGTNLPFELIYCFTDSEPLLGINYYRVTHYSVNNTFLRSEVIQLKMPSAVVYTKVVD